MRRTAWLLAPGMFSALIGTAKAVAPLPALVPVDDPLATTAMLPPGINQNPAELSGLYAHIWQQADGTQIIQYYGDFTLRLGQRRLRSREAVIWMQSSLWGRTNYYHFEVFLYKNAEVRETADSISTGPALFVTFNSLQPPVVEADVPSGKAAADTKLYKEATAARLNVVSDAGAAVQPLDLPHPPGLSRAPRIKTRSFVQHTSKEKVYDEREGTVTVTGDVYLSQGGGGANPAEFLEIRADAAVLFLAERARGAAPRAGNPQSPQTPFPTETARGPSGRDSAGLGGDFNTQVNGAYLRGNVVLTRGERMIRASELYYDFENDRALMLDAVMRTALPGREIPLYVRAKQVRQLSSTEFFARKADISASEFNTPHLSLGAERVYLTDTTARDQAGEIAGIQGGRYRAYDATLNLEGVPIAYSPYSQGDVQQAQNLLDSVRITYSDNFGASFQSKWYLFSLLGLETPQGVDAILRLDYFSKRGPGVGLDVDYEKENSYGQFRGYFIHDTGTDNLGPFRSGDPDTQNRGRFTIRHRQFLPGKIELTLEASYISDPNFLEEYFRREFERGKEQETLVYLKKQEDNWAFTTLAQWRVLDFLTQTEHLPEMGFHWIGQPLGEIADFYHESRIGAVRYQPDNRQIYSSSEYRSRVVFRGDTRNEIDFPIKLGDANIVPFAMARPSYWDDSPVDGPLSRLFGMAGVRLGTQVWRTFQNIQSRIFDVNGIRHIIRPQATAWASASSKDSRDLYPFDPYVENINDFYGTSLALRNTWETKRGGPGQWRTVDWMKFDVELNLFGNQPRQPLFWSSYNKLPIGRFYDSRPENSIARDHVKTDYMYRISDSTAILSDANFDLNDGDLDLFNISYAVERSPRFSYFVAYRWIGPTESNLVGGGVNYQINEKHTIALRSFYDLDRGKLEQLDFAIVRKFPRFNAAVTFGLDNIEKDFHIGLSLWPEGSPKTALGSRQFTRISDSTGLRSED